MNSLQDSWQEQRKQRQHELAQRQQQVRETLAAFQQSRQVKAAQLRDDLSLFQLELQQTTQNFLVQASQERQIKAQQLAQFLQDFVQSLQAETEQFLSLTAANRATMAQQLFQDLDNFHAKLNHSVAALRLSLQTRMQQLQAEVQVLQAEAHTLLKAHQQQRIQNQMKVIADLAKFMETLRTEVQTYLSELELVRQDRAQQLQNMLQHSRRQRLAEVDVLFQQLSVFRSELRQYCVDLQQMVWGNAAPAASIAMPSPTPTQPIATAPTQPHPPQPASVASPAIVEQSAPLSAIALPPIEDTSKTLEANPTLAIKKDPAEVEEEIFGYIYQNQGARLTEIESELQVNRFQAVDALRSLIKQGLITQRDRVYLVQEEVSL